MKRSKAGVVLILACVAACVAGAHLTTACGGSGDDDDDGGEPPPPTVMATAANGVTVTIATDPLALTLTTPTGTYTMAQFVEVGVVANGQVDPARYYDPAQPPTSVTFRKALRATSWEPTTGRLALALDGAGGGAAYLTLSPSAVLTVETGEVPGAVYARFALPYGGEDLYGFGWRLDSPVTKHQVREMQFRLDFETETSLNEQHAPVPLAIDPARQIGFFAEERRVGAFDVGAARPDAVVITYTTASLALHVFGGDAFAILDQYTTETGRPLVPPYWSFAPMQWRNEHESSQDVRDDAAAIRANGIPGSTLWIDNPWQTGYNDFTFDPARFPDAPALIAELDALGFRTLLWSTPYVGTDGTTMADHLEAAQLGYLIHDDTGRPIDLPWQDGPGALVDFTAPGATAWWQERIARVVDLGIAGFKLDFGEDLVPDFGGNVSPFYLNQGRADVWHNHYAGLYHAAYLDALPPGDGFLLTRAGAWGEQTTNTCLWGADLDADFSRWDGVTIGGLPAAMAIGLSLSASGYPFFGSDIGGFRGFPTTEVLLRWAEYAALGTIMQLGGGGASHNPWNTMLFGPEALPIYKKYARLHTDLFPYLYTYAKQAGDTGVPVTRAPGLVHVGHPYEDAFLTGDALFVAPVVEPGATTRTVTLPPGDWVDWWTGTKTTGGGQVTVAAPLDTLPLWRRVGAVVVLLAAPVDTLLPATGWLSFADPAVARGLKVQVTPAGSPSTFDVYDGATVATTATATQVTVSATPGTVFKDFRFELDWANSPAAAVTPASAGGLPAVADDAALDACGAPGCWRYDAVGGRALVRLVDGGSATIQ